MTALSLVLFRFSGKLSIKNSILLYHLNSLLAWFKKKYSSYSWPNCSASISSHIWSYHYNSESCIIQHVWAGVLNLEEAFSAASGVRIAILRNIIHKALLSLKYKVSSLAAHQKINKIPDKFCQTQKSLVIYLTMEFRCLGLCFW